MYVKRKAAAELPDRRQTVQQRGRAGGARKPGSKNSAFRQKYTHSLVEPMHRDASNRQKSDRW